MEKKYYTIYADPPWNEHGGGKIQRGADRYYPLMNTSEIIEMKDFINEISEENCHLYLWITNNFLEDGLKVMNEWGFDYKTIITWNKVLYNEHSKIVKGKIGLGQYFRGVTEHCLFGVKGKLPYKENLENKRVQGLTGFYTPLSDHSVKPEIMRKMIEDVSYPPYIELFARRKFKSENWDFWGNEVEENENDEFLIKRTNSKLF